ncbi:MAG: hypothetical protein WA945_03125, partial [Arcobacteraceae bacterium]
MDYKNIDLKQQATKGYADIASYMEELGELASNMKSQQILKLLNHQVILKGLSQVSGLNSNFDESVSRLLTSVEDALEKKKTPFVKIFSFHILFFVVLFFITILVSPQSANIGYALSSVAMGCATGVLNLMLLREKKKYAINTVFFMLEEELIENYFDLHKNIAKTIETFRKENKIDEVQQLDTVLKSI